MQIAKQAFGGGLLFVAAVMIWIQSASSHALERDSGLLLLALPVLLFIPGILKWKGGKVAPHANSLPFSGLLLLFAGLLLQITALAALGWAYCAATWLKANTWTTPGKLELLAVLSLGFPWIEQDLSYLAWVFRWSGAYTTDLFASWVGLDVVRHGVLLRVEGLPVEIAPACAGMQSLQVLLFSSGIVCLCGPKAQGLSFWRAQGLMFLAAIFSHHLRIWLLTLSGLWFGKVTASGTLHDVVGFFSLSFAVLLWILWQNKSRAPLDQTSRIQGGKTA